MPVSGDLKAHVFIIGRKFTYSRRIYIQFRARHPTGQETVDPYKLSISFKDAIKKENLEEIDAHPSPTQTIILQSMIDEHASVIGSSVQFGHFKTDGTSLIANEDGVLSCASVVPNTVKIYVQSTAPTNPNTNDVWIDIS